MKDRRAIYLADHDHLRIRLLSVSVDSIPKGGGRALFELSTMHEHQAALVLTVEAPEFRAAAAGRIPERKYAEITAEAAARLREDLQAMIEAVDGMAEQVRRTGLPRIPKRDPGPPYYRVRMDPSDPTGRGSLFEQTTAPGDTTCGTCKTPIAAADTCYAIYVSPENRDLLGYRCTKSLCIDGERIDFGGDGLRAAADPYR